MHERNPKRAERPVQFVTTEDSRQLAVAVTGHPEGYAVMLMHGTPGSRIGPKPRPSALYQSGITLVAYDRPGYGDSDCHPGRRIADGAADVRAIMDQLGHDESSVLVGPVGDPMLSPLRRCLVNGFSERLYWPAWRRLK